MVVDARAAFDHARQDVVDVANRKRIVHAVVAHRAFRAGARSVPRFTFGIAFAAEQDHFAMAAPGNQREHRFGFGESGEVMEIAVLAIRIVTVVVAQTLGRGRHDADRVVADDAHQLLAAARVFLAIDHRSGLRAEG